MNKKLIYFALFSAAVLLLAIPPQARAQEGAVQKPVFDSGSTGDFTEWVTRNVRYPQDAFAARIQGKVFYKLVIEKDGTVGNVEIIEAPTPSMGEEVIRVIKSSPAWTPGKRDGEPIRVSFNGQITFALDPGNVENASFRGGDNAEFDKWVAGKVKFPKEASKEGRSGIVEATYVVAEDGSVSDIKIISSPDNSFSEEVTKVIQSSPKWTPGLRDGTPFRQEFGIAVNFELRRAASGRGMSSGDSFGGDSGADSNDSGSGDDPF